MNRHENFDPLWVPLLTHYENKNNLTLDKDLILKHINWLRPYVKQYLICGTTGDGWNLDDKLILNWLEILKDKNTINKDNKILFGAFGKTTDDVLRRTSIIEDYLIKYKTDANFFGLTLCAPIGDSITQKEIIDHFENILNNTSLPISIYQLPQIVKCKIKPETLKTLKNNFNKRIKIFKDTSGEDEVINSRMNFEDIIFLRGAEESYFNYLKPNGKYDGFLLSSANPFGKLLRQIIDKIKENKLSEAEELSKTLSKVINTSFTEGQKLSFGNPFSNVNRGFVHILLNNKNLKCNTCFGESIPSNFLTFLHTLLTKNKLNKSL